MPSITINDVQKDLADYRLYAQTKIKLEELEKKIFQESVYEGLFSRVRSGSHADSNRTVDSKVKEGRHVPIDLDVCVSEAGDSWLRHTNRAPMELLLPLH